MITNMQFLGIYEDAINNSIEVAEAAMRMCGFSEKEIIDMHDIAIEKLEEYGDWKDITNSIIDAYFSTAKYFIDEKSPEMGADYYVNCLDSHFYLEGLKVFA